MTTGLVLVDIQKDYFPGGRAALEGSLEAVRQARRLLEHFRALGLPVIHLQHLSRRPEAPFFLPGTPGVDFHEDVLPLSGEPVVQKHYPNGFRDTFLLHRLLEVDIQRVVFAGMMTHMCVDATVRAAYDQGFECVIASDACAARDLVFEGAPVPAALVHRAFLAALHDVYGQVRTTEDILAEMRTGPRPLPRPA